MIRLKDTVKLRKSPNFNNLLEYYVIAIFPLGKPASIYELIIGFLKRTSWYSAVVVIFLHA